MDNVLQTVINIFRDNNLFIIYLYSALLLFIIDFFYILCINLYIYSIRYRLRKGKIKENTFLDQICSEYQRITLQGAGIKTQSFIDSFFKRKKHFLLRSIELIELSDSIFFMLGLLASFTIILSSLLSIDLKNLQGMEDLYQRLTGFLPDLKSALFFFLLGIILSIIINILKKLWNSKKSLLEFEEELKNYLEIEIGSVQDVRIRQLEVLKEIVSALKKLNFEPEADSLDIDKQLSNLENEDNILDNEIAISQEQDLEKPE